MCFNRSEDPAKEKVLQMPMRPEIRLLQTVVRDRDEDAQPSTYRYDLLTDCASDNTTYIIRARRSIVRESGDIVAETTGVVKPIQGEEAIIREVFLDIAYADVPVNPLHLGDIVEDNCVEGPLADQQVEMENSQEAYLRYDL